MDNNACLYIVLVIGVLLHIISMVSPYWEYAENQIGSSHSGLWSVCIWNKCTFLTCDKTRTWFKVVQVFFVVSLIFEMMCLVFRLLQNTSFVVSHITQLKTSLFEAIMLTAGGILSFISVFLYGYYQGIDGDLSTLSWAFYLAFVVVMSEILTTALSILHTRNVMKRPKVNETPLISPADSFEEISISVPETIRIRTNSVPCALNEQVMEENEV